MPEDPMLEPEMGEDMEVEEAGEQEGRYTVQFGLSVPNIAEYLSDDELGRIGRLVCEGYERDEESLKANGYRERTKAAMELALQTAKAKNYPWPGAANVKYPLITTAAIQFAARAYPAIVDGWNVVKGKALGEPTPEKIDRAQRIGRHMTWQLLEQMEGWEEDTDRLLHMLPIIGCVVRKTYFDRVKGHNCSELIAPDKFVVNYWTKDLDSCPRATHILEYYPNEIEERFRSEIWRKAELNLRQGEDEQAPHEFLEQYCLLDLDEDGYDEPYTVTVHKETSQVVRIAARFDPEGVLVDARGEIVAIKPVRYFTKYGFIPSPDGSFYDLGFGQLCGPLNETINSVINQLLDAGHLANLGGGFLGGNSASLKSGVVRVKPGEWKREPGVSRDTFVPLPTADPSPVLFNLLNLLIEATRDITATKDILTGDTAGSNEAVGTTLAKIDQGLKVFSAIYKRIHRSLKWELATLRRLNRLYLNPEEYFVFHDEQEASRVTLDDYADDDIDVVPVSDPNLVTDMQRVAQAQLLMSFMGDPMVNQEQIRVRILEAARVEGAKNLVAQPPPPQPDPKTVLETAKQQREDFKAQVEANKAAAEIVAKNVETERKQMENLMAGPALAQMVQAMVDEAMAEARMVMDAQSSAVPGMDGGQPDQGVPGLPGGPQPVPGGPMGGGGGPDPAAAGAGGPVPLPGQPVLG